DTRRQPSPSKWLPALLMVALLVFVALPVPADTGLFVPDPTVPPELQTTVWGYQTQTLAPGVLHRFVKAQNDHGPLLINLLDIDYNHPDVVLLPVLADENQSLHGKAKVADIMAQVQRRNNVEDPALRVLAGINGSFFKPDTGTTLGTFISKGDLLTGPIHNRVAVGITPDKQVLFDRVQVSGQITTDMGTTLQFHNVNQPRLNKDWVLYTSAWGAHSPATPDQGTQILLRRGTTNQLYVDAIGTQSFPIPENGFVLLGPPTQDFSRVEPGQSATLKMTLNPDWSDVAYALSGGPYLVKRGQVYVDAKAQKLATQTFNKPAPRTAIGVTADKHVLLVTVDGRQDDLSVGMTLYELAYFMRGLGAVYAINLDGGTSTQMVIGQQLVSHPKTEGGVKVGNALLVEYKGLASIPTPLSIPPTEFQTGRPTPVVPNGQNRHEPPKKPFSFLD
ncbi:MAG: phosphodiester glycosidase family protein, partial [Cyanobacteria bacterium HKST-UBA06]|nr:phosphodiester glycosidase family protein [Cyanobacteria bacterium HKST-UBA06]